MKDICDEEAQVETNKAYRVMGPSRNHKAYRVMGFLIYNKYYNIEFTAVL
jgi:hypothetical protein